MLAMYSHPMPLRLNATICLPEALAVSLSEPRARLIAPPIGHSKLVFLNTFFFNIGILIQIYPVFFSLYFKSAARMYDRVILFLDR